MASPNQVAGSHFRGTTPDVWKEENKDPVDSQEFLLSYTLKIVLPETTKTLAGHSNYSKLILMNHDLMICIFLFASAGCATRGVAQEANELDTPSSLEETIVESEIDSPAAPRQIISNQASTQAGNTPVTTTKKPDSAISPVQEITSFDTISAAEIRTRQRRGIEDVLRQSAGVTLVQTGQSGNQTSLFVRGQESDHTVVLLNGRRLPPGLAGLYQLEFLDVSTLESVQLHRGPLSSLYGSDALAGALDLRSTDARFVQDNTFEGFAETGSFETTRSGVRLGLREGQVGIAIDAAGTRTANDRPNSDFENRIVRGNLAYDLADGVQIDFLGYLQDASVVIAGPNPAAFGPPFPANQLNQNTSYLFSPRLTISRENWDFSLFYSHSGNELIASRTGGNDNTLKQVGEEVETLFHLRASETLEWTLGAGHYHYDFGRVPVGRAPTGFHYGFTGIFSQVDWEFLPDTTLLASYRYDEHDSFSSKGTYSVQLSHNLSRTGTTAFARIATGYKVPSGQDYAFLDPSVAPGSLLPEESESIEFGLKQQIGENSQINISYFETDLDNLVDGRFSFVTFTSFPTVVDTEIRGTEIEFRTSPLDGLELYANYTWLDTVITRGLLGFGANRPGDRLPRRPTHSLSGGILLEGDRWNAGLEVNGAYSRLDSGNVPLEDYTVARIFGNFALNDSVEVYGRVENVFDEQFETVRSFAAPGTGAYIGCRVVLGQ